MNAWYDVVEPHQDIKEGNFDESIFAADLGDVALEKAPIDYNDPGMFYKKTYFTEGITNILTIVYNRLKNGKGPSVVEIKTPFGGGKTHALISIYHYLKNGNKIPSQLPKGLKPFDAWISVIVGTHLNPIEGNSRDGLNINTLWGEIAFQLAGKEGYEKFKENDTNRVSPGKEKLRAFLETCQPFIILCDEVLEYITKARGVKYHETNLASQTYAFLQELSETISSLKNAMLIVSLPSSHLQDYSERDLESLAKLENALGRIESFEETVKGEEMYSIIQRRLFSEIKNPEEKNTIIVNYIDFYRKHKDELLPKASETNLKRKIELSYPFHPELIDILYEKWGTFPSFQRTRGVLRLLANVIEDLYNKEKNVDIILPADIDLEAAAVRQEFLKHIGSEYEGIIGSDISGHGAKSIALDKENKGWKHLAQRISTSIFFYSFSGDQSEKGATLEHIKYAVMHRDTLPSMITEVLQKLNKSLWYLNEKRDMFRFSKIPNLNRMILEKKEFYNITYKEELKKLLQKEVGNAFISFLWPNESEDIPDNKEIKLVLLKPEINEETTNKWLEKRGNTFRAYKNTIIFTLADPVGFGALKEEIKKYLALKEIEKEITSDKKTGLWDKISDIKDRIKKIQNDFSFNTRRMYNKLIIGKEKITLGQPTIGKESLSNWYKTELESREKLAQNLHYRYIVNKFLTEKEKIETKIIDDQFYKDTTLVTPTNQDVIKRSIQQGIAEGAFGLGYISNEKIEKETLKFKTNIPINIISLDEGEILISSKKAIELYESLKVKEEEDQTKYEEPEKEKQEDTKKTGEGPKRLKNISIRIEDIPSSKIADLSRGVLMPLSREIGGFKFHMDLEIESEEGIPEQIFNNQIKETISQIGAKITKEKTK